MPLITKQEAEKVLKLALGDETSEFRDGQWEAINEVVNNSSKALVVQRTGWGKSAVYFITSRIFKEQNKGITVIISPLLSLMRNQIDSGKKFGVNVVSINSSNVEDWEECNNQILQGKADCLIIAPERLANENFNNKVLNKIKSKIGLFVIDEAHCISDWGHDFRPDYRRIVSILKALPSNTPVLCTTATANQRVIDDIEEQIGSIKILKGSLVRDNLKLYSYKMPSLELRLASLVEILNKIDGTGIIYTLTIRDAKKVADWLKLNNIKAEPYTGKMESEERKELEDKLLNNKVKALVATSALGMGYDKPDLSFVIHFQTPSSIIDYYQQVGRAGRGIESAVGVLFLGSEDGDINTYFRESAFPKSEDIIEILDILENSDGLSITEITQETNLKKGIIEKTIKFLSVAKNPPILKDDNKWSRTTNQYSLDEERVETITAKRLEEWNQMLDYVDTADCKMAFLQESLDDEDIYDCDNCQSCELELFDKENIPEELVEFAIKFLNRLDYPIEPRKQWPVKEIFGEYDLAEKLNIPEDLRSEEGRVLSVWGSGIGDIVRKCKEQGEFNDELVEKFVKMINRFDVEDEPQWICYVPSLNNPTMVRNFSYRVADKLGIPCYDIIDKVKANEPQKIQHNSFSQAKNLDGVFDIDADILPSELFSEPCFLIDDIVDSKWTFTILSALLRQKGSGNIYPLALATAEVG